MTLAPGWNPVATYFFIEDSHRRAIPRLWEAANDPVKRQRKATKDRSKIKAARKQNRDRKRKLK